MVIEFTEMAHQTMDVVKEQEEEKYGILGTMATVERDGRTIDGCG